MCIRVKMRHIFVIFNMFCVVILASYETSERTNSSSTVLPTSEEIPRNAGIKPIDISEFKKYKNTTIKGASRKSKNLLEWTIFNTRNEADPYLSRVNLDCISGDLSECFKLKALSSLDDFFDRDAYWLNDNAKVVRMPKAHLRQLNQEPFEYSSTPRAEEPEWDQFVKFLMRKVERFIKSTAIEVQFPNEVTNGGRYAPRFIDEIATEIDIIEDKNESTFCKYIFTLQLPLFIHSFHFKVRLL